MPWDGTELRPRRRSTATAGRSMPRVVAGSASDWIAQPRWSPDGVLHFVAEPDGWMNLFRLGADGAVEPVDEPIEAEFAFPDWEFGFANYAFRRRRLDPRDRPERRAATGCTGSIRRRRRPRRSTCRSPR